MSIGRTSRLALRPRTTTRSRPTRWGRTRLWLNNLEDRAVPAILTVTDPGDAGPNTLRGILATANTNAEDDTIQFSGVSLVTLTSGQISYTENKLLTIDGTGVTVNSTAAALATSRIFSFNVAGGNPTITINGLTMSGGNLSSGNNGGAILVNNDPLVLDGVTFSGNKSASAGGAIASTTAALATVTLKNSTFTGNSATTTGGAIHGTSSITLDISNTSFGSNTATSTGGAIHTAGTATITINASAFNNNLSSSSGGVLNTASSITLNVTGSTFSGNKGTSGGAIRLASSSSTMTLNTSTFSGNAATGSHGGGLYFFIGGSLTVNDSTFSGNTAATNGGGIALFSATGTINNSTISGNTANGTGTGGGGGISLNSSASLNVNNSTVAFNTASAGTGGGIRRSSTTGTVTISSSIVAANTSASGGADLNNSSTATLNVGGGDNVIGVADVGNFTLAGINQTGTAGSPLNPVLAALGNYGGPTLTHALLAGSPALDVGNNALALSFDQRGSGFPRVVNGLADAGAFEGFLKIPQAKATLLNVTSAGGTTYTATVEYTDETGINVGSIDLNDVTLSGTFFGGGSFGPVSPVSFGTSGSGTLVTATYTFNAPGGVFDGADNGNYSLSMVAGQVFDTDGPNAVNAGSLGTFQVLIPSTYTVDITDDEDDGNTTPGDLSLREALKLSNASAGVPDIINFAGGLSGKTIKLGGTELSVTDAVTITGLGSGLLTVSGDNASRIFNIAITGAGGAVSVSGMTLTAGKFTGSGGAITMSDDALTLTDVIVTGNTATSAGGGILMTTGTLKVIDSTISNNSASGSTGGAIDFSSGTVEIIRSTISGNFASSTGGFTDFTTGSLTVRDSTVSKNTSNSTSGGGAINVTTGKVTIVNSTFSGNSANVGAAVGGALRGTSSLTLTVDNSTFTGNVASGAGGGAFAFTATTLASQPVVNIASTILAQNLNTSHPELYSAATTVTLTVNINDSIIGADSGLVILNGVNNQIGFVGSELNAKLAPLGNYGGPTQTHGLLPGSPALNTGTNLLTLSNDQRGAGFPRTLGGTTDVGAFEGELKIPVAQATLADVTTGGGTTYVATVVYTDETGINVGSIDLNDVTLSGTLIGGGTFGPVSPVSFGTSGSGTLVTATYTFNAPGGAFDFTDNGTYTLTMVANQVFDTDGPSAALPGPLDSFAVAIATTHTVDLLGDVDDGSYGAGQLTLREAMKLANQVSGTADTVAFAPALNGQAIQLTGELSVTDAVVIQGNGAANTIVDGSTVGRLFNFTILGLGAESKFSGLTLTGGKVTGAGGAILLNDDALTLSNAVVSLNEASTNGGGIQMTGGTLKVINSTLSNNLANTDGGAIHTTTAAAVIEVTGSTITGNTGDAGGGIYLTSAKLTVTNSTISNNKAGSGYGGGISFSTGKVSVSGTTISNNTSTSTGGGIRLSSGTLDVTVSTISGNSSGTTGGGVYMTTGTLNMSYSTVSGNSAASASTGGGGLSLSTGTATISNSTFSGNKATGSGSAGGGIRVSSSGNLTVYSSTVVQNTAAGNGGGFSFGSASAAVNIDSIILAQNTSAIHPDLFSSVTATLTVNLSFSVIGALTDGDVVINGFANQSGTLAAPFDPQIGPLGAYGGPTATHGLSPFSPALDAGNNPSGSSFDQRGAGFPRQVGGQSDIGAFEGISPVPLAAAKALDVTTAGGVSHVITVEYGDDVGINTGTLGNDDIVVSGGGFASPVPGAFVGFTGSGQKVTATYTITPPGGVWDAFDSGKYTISVNPGAVTDGVNAVAAGPVGSFRVGIAGNFVVNSAADEDDVDYGPGDFTLREAIRLANASVGGTDTIGFAAGLKGQTIALTLGELAVTDGVIINGLGSGQLTVSGSSASRVFNINNGAAGSMTVSISGLKLTGGKVTGDGGAIFIQDEDVTLTDLVITANSATIDGGGINVEADGGKFTLINSSVSNNSGGTTGDADGGGINFEGATVVTITNSTIAGNTTFDDGGGLLFQKRAAGHTVLIEGTTVSGNTSNATTGGGGGINFGGTFLGLTIRNSTISGNTTKKDGGGLQFYAVVDPVLIQNTTIAFNSGTGAASNGGGINQFTDATGTITLESTIVSDNTAFNGLDVQSANGTVAAQKSALGSTSVTNFIDNGGNLIGQALLLAPLAANGGPTQTIRPASNSPVVNAGFNPFGLTTDQRGAGFPRQVGAAVDIGSLEVDPNTPAAKVTLTDVTTAGGASYVFTVTYTDDVAINVATLGTGDVEVAGPNSFTATPVFTGVDINTNGSPRVATYVLTPPGGAWNDLDNGTYTIVLAKDEVKDAGGISVPDGPLGSFKVAIPVVVTVDTLVDENDGDYSPGDLSLREAIGLSNSSPASLNVIDFAPALFSGGAKTITLSLGEIVVSAGVTINGPGADLLTVSGNNASRVFNIDDGTTSKITVEVNGMTLANGKSNGSISVVADGGGAMFIDGEIVTLDGMELRNNTAASFGGAILANSGTQLVILNSSLHNNAALGGDTTRGGGAIEIEALSGSTLLVRNCTIAFNQAGVNTTSSVGGAIIAWSGVPIVTIENSTITQNKAHQAGGVRVFSTPSGVLNITSSIVSGNTGTTSQPDFQTGSTPTNITLSMIGSTTGLGGAAVLDGFSTANVGVSPNLGPLQDNGGPTQTMALLAGSPAIDQGSNPSGLTSDQRGSPFLRQFGTAVDIGAFEVQPAPVNPPTVTSVKVNGAGNQRSMVTSLVVTFSEAVTFPSGVNAAFQLNRIGQPTGGPSSGAPLGSVNLSAIQVGNTVTITFLGGGAVPVDAGGSLIDGAYQLTIVAANVQGAGGNLDGDGNGAGGDNFQTPAAGAGRVHRLFGDNDGDADVDAIDYGAFRGSFGGTNPVFDYDADGDVDAIDYGQFRPRFGVSV